jgi:hypothetical protein
LSFQIMLRTCANCCFTLTWREGLSDDLVMQTFAGKIIL